MGYTLLAPTRARGQEMAKQGALLFVALFFLFIMSAADASHSQTPSTFLHSAASTSSRAKKRRRIHCREGGESTSYGEEVAAYNVSNRSRRGSRPPRRNSSQQSCNTRQNARFSRKTGLSNICPPLDGPVGSPELPVLVTRDPRIIERWLEDHVGSSDDEYTILGFDQETISKPPWMPDRQKLPDGPATIQLSTPTSCIIVQLSRCGDGSAIYAPDVLRNVINDRRIIKVGVGIDDDALELYRWSKESIEDAPQLWEMTSRFDIGCVLPDNNPSRRSGIRDLAKKVIGANVPKSKKLSMSNWGKKYLSLEQISYAARDAWVSAAIVEQLQIANNDVFGAEAIMQMEFMKKQRAMDVMDKRAASRKAAKIELKELIERQKSNLEETTDDDEERKRELYNLLDLYRPDMPPNFEDGVFTLPLY